MRPLDILSKSEDKKMGDSGDGYELDFCRVEYIHDGFVSDESFFSQKGLIYRLYTV